MKQFSVLVVANGYVLSFQDELSGPLLVALESLDGLIDFITDNMEPPIWGENKCDHNKGGCDERSVVFDYAHDGE